MEDQFQKALEFANHKQTFSIQRKTLKEKINAKLTYGYNGGIFKIDRNLISFMQMLVDQGRLEGVAVIDDNENPILIDNVTEFRDEIMDRYFSSSIEYLNAYNQLKKTRTVEKLLDL
jgi:hypothetical protein